MYDTHRQMFKLILVAILISGCTLESGKMLEANKEIVRRFFAETDAHNFAAYDQLLTDNTVAHFPNGVVMDRETVENNERAFAAAFPDATRSIDMLFAEGDFVALRETFRGTHVGALAGIEPSGRQVVVTVNIIYRIADGKIAESWVEADLGTFLASLSQSEDRD